MTLSAFLAACLLHLAAAASPGPAVLLTARTGVTEGLRVGAWLAVGIGLGAVVWAVAAIFGLALLFELAPTLLGIFKLAGAAFLLWLAVGMWRHARDPLGTAPAHGNPRSAASALKLGVLTQLANPKPAIFFGAVFIGTVPPGTAASWIAALLFAIFLNEFLCNLAVARAFSFDRPRRAYARLKSHIDRTFGGILALLGAKVALT
jgi:threonine/homoserine/homoserine lactone efflux protein